MNEFKVVRYSDFRAAEYGGGLKFFDVRGRNNKLVDSSRFNSSREVHNMHTHQVFVAR